ncbi:MAG: HRDC domain-containing protein, partial [Bacteroidaceae bacterium]|nr:HRDC domain-containing protein [Bacteroidaceae bacterium]
TFTYRAKITGNFPEYNYPTEETLTLKEGAQVMFIKNDHSGERRYFNGMIGEIVSIDQEGFVVHSQDFNGEIRVEREQWDNTRYTLNEQTMEINEEVEGSFEQFPVRLAWAITIHKSQGLTFSHAIIDARDSFAHGQVYVALSRCRTLEGMVLSSPLSAGAIICDTTVNNFNAAMAQRTPGATAIDTWEKRYYHQLVQELFSFDTLLEHFNDLHRLVAEHFGILYPQLLEQFNFHAQSIQNKLCDIATRFATQYTRIISEQADYASSSLLKERIHNASKYFLDEFSPICQWAEQLSIPTDNKELKKRIADYTEKLGQSCTQKYKLLEFVHEEGFDISSYLHKKAVISLEAEGGADTPTPSKSRRKKSEETILQVPSDIMLPDLYQRVVSWKQKKAQELGIPGYCVLQQKALLGIVHFLPDNPKSLLKIPYMGKTTVEKYGKDLLEIITAYMKENNLTTKI